MSNRYSVTVTFPGVMFDGEHGLIRDGKPFPRRLYKFPVTVNGEKIKIALDYAKNYNGAAHRWTRAFDDFTFVDALSRTVSEHYPQLRVEVTERRIISYDEKLHHRLSRVLSTGTGFRQVLVPEDMYKDGCLDSDYADITVIKDPEHPELIITPSSPKTKVDKKK